MGSSIVLELQRMATEPDADVSGMLRQALVIATKLKQEEFKKWIDSELNGYSDDVPAYRKVRMELKTVNPYAGLVQTTFADPKLQEALTLVDLRAPMPHLLKMVEERKGQRRGGRYITLAFTPEQDQILRGYAGDDLDFPLVRAFTHSQVEGVAEAVRNALLEWTLRLEAEGILGEGMTFSREEKERAISHQVNIGTFQGIFGDVIGSNVTQNLTQRIKKGDWAALKKHLQKLNVQADALTELTQALKTDSPATQKNRFGPHVGGWIAKMVGRAATGAWQIAVGAAGNSLSEALNAYYGIS